MYNFIKALHVISVIAWMAGLLYLPRLFVYHVENKDLLDITAVFKRMELRLYKYIMTPALFFTWISGLYIAIDSGFYVQNWFKIKFTLIILLTLFHFYLQRHIALLRKDIHSHSPRFYRLINEIPTLIMILVVILVVIKPEISF
jgi:protoporphyrinogen IX oxidase